MKCLNKSIRAWRSLAKKREEFNKSAKHFLAFLENIKQGFKNETDLKQKEGGTTRRGNNLK